MCEQGFDHANEVMLVNPRHVLATISSPSAKTETGQLTERGKNATLIGAHDHGGPHQDNTSVRQWPDTLDGGLPRFGHIDTKAPGIWRIWFFSSNDPCDFVIWDVEPVGVDRRGTGLQPEGRRFLRLFQRKTDGACGIYPGFKNVATITRSIPAIYAATGKVDDNIRLLEFCGPQARSFSIPADCSIGTMEIVAPRKNEQIMLRTKRPPDDFTDLTSSASDDYFHVVPSTSASNFHSDHVRKERARPLPGYGELASVK